MPHLLTGQLYDVPDNRLCYLHPAEMEAAVKALQKQKTPAVDDDAKVEHVAAVDDDDAGAKPTIKSGQKRNHQGRFCGSR